MVESTGPVDDDIGFILVETSSSSDTSAGVELAEFEQTIKHWTIFSDIESLKLTDVFLHIVGRNDLQKVDVIIRMKPGHGRGRHQMRSKDFHFMVEIVIDDQIVCHADAVRLHGMSYHCVQQLEWGKSHGRQNRSEREECCLSKERVKFTFAKRHRFLPPSMNPTLHGPLLQSRQRLSNNHSFIQPRASPTITGKSVASGAKPMASEVNKCDQLTDTHLDHNDNCRLRRHRSRTRVYSQSSWWREKMVPSKLGMWMIVKG